MISLGNAALNRRLPRLSCEIRCVVARSAVIRARIDSSTKETTERVLRDFGITPTGAILLFYRQIAIRDEFPLELLVPNSITAALLAEADRGEELETFPSAAELLEHETLS